MEPFFLYVVHLPIRPTYDSVSVFMIVNGLDFLMTIICLVKTLCKVV